MAPHRRGIVPELVLACTVIAATLLALDRVVAWSEIGYRAARGRPSEDRRLVRPEFDVRVVTNALGFRERRLPSPKRLGTLRVVVLGDSFTQGYGVEEAAAYPRLLEPRLAATLGRPVEVVNLGVPGTSPRDYVAHLRDPGLAYLPDVVVVGVMGNDVQDVWIQRRFGVRFAAEVLRDVQRELVDTRPLWRRAPAIVLPALYPFVWTQVAEWRGTMTPAPSAAHAAAAPPAAPAPIVPADRWREVVLTMGERFGRRDETARTLDALPPERAHAVAAIATGAASFDSDEGVEGYLDLLATVDPRLLADAVLLPPAYDDAWRATAGYLATIVRTARAAGSRVLIAYIPAIHQITEAARPGLEANGFVWDPRTLVDTTIPDRLRAFGAAEDVPIADLTPAFRAARDRPLYYPRDGHWTAAGHALAAAELTPAIAAVVAR